MPVGTNQIPVPQNKAVVNPLPKSTAPVNPNAQYGVDQYGNPLPGQSVHFPPMQNNSVYGVDDYGNPLPGRAVLLPPGGTAGSLSPVLTPTVVSVPKNYGPAYSPPAVASNPNRPGGGFTGTANAIKSALANAAAKAVPSPVRSGSGGSQINPLDAMFTDLISRTHASGLANQAAFDEALKAMEANYARTDSALKAQTDAEQADLAARAHNLGVNLQDNTGGQDWARKLFELSQMSGSNRTSDENWVSKMKSLNGDQYNYLENVAIPQDKIAKIAQMALARAKAAGSGSGKGNTTVSETQTQNNVGVPEFLQGLNDTNAAGFARDMLDKAGLSPAKALELAIANGTNKQYLPMFGVGRPVTNVMTDNKIPVGNAFDRVIAGLRALGETPISRKITTKAKGNA